MLDGISRFTYSPVNLNIKRSAFNRPSQLKTTFNAGRLIPIYVDEVLPGDTFNMKTNFVIRESTPIKAVMDNSFIDIYYFFVPSRLVWTGWKEFMGENTNGYWIPAVEKVLPHIKVVDNDNTVTFPVGSIADYFGIPTNTPVTGLSFDSLPFKCYGLIWNEFFRDQNTQAPLFIPTSDADITYSWNSANNGDNFSYFYRGACNPLPVNKFHDYFTSCLPGPQKGPSVDIPLGQFADVIATDMGSSTPTSYEPIVLADDIAAYKDTQGTSTFPLVADLSNATAATINQLRQAFAVQRLYEKDALGGTRYREMIKAHFGVTSPDARQQVPELLGGKRIPINMNQVVQTSSSDTTSPQGNTAAFSLTSDSSSSFVKSFTEHGYLIGVACVRTEHTYQQGIERFWSRRRRFDFYFPALANIGEQPVYNKEIYVTGGANYEKNDEVFGYQEAWADYRYKPSRTSGYMRSGISGSLDIWHYGDNFNARPVLNSDFMKETAVNIDRTLAVPSTSGTHQFIADFFFECKVSRPMPLYSIPGMVDHN